MRVASIGSVIPLLLLVADLPAGAQTVGTFSWQQQPYCNVLTLTVVQDGGLYRLDGFDDQCGAARRASATGVGFINPNGSIGLGLTLVTNDGSAAGGAPLHIDVTLSPSSVSGSWRDSSGGGGAWTFVPGRGIGGAPRPLPARDAVPGPNTVNTSALLPGVVTAEKLAANAVTGATVVDGSLTVADLLDFPKVAFAQGPQQVSLQNGTPTTVRSLAITPVSPGHLVVSASGTFDRLTGFSLGRCSISTGTAIEPPYSTTTSADSAGSAPFAVTRVLPVTPSGPITVNLVCDKWSGFVDVWNTNLSALFVAGS